MGLSDWVKALVKGNSIGCSWKYDFEGVNFIFTSQQKAKIAEGSANELLMHQYIALRMLVEQGEGAELPNGVMVPSASVVELDEDVRHLLDLPPVWAGKLHANIKGKTGSVSFQIELKASDVGGTPTYGFEVEGPIISFSLEKHYLLSPAQLLVFSAWERHKHSDRSEYDDLALVYAFQQAQEKGASISLGHFQKLNIRVPESITVEAELDGNGRLILTPQMGQAATHERMQKVLGQLMDETATSLRIDDEIILFDKPRMAAVREVLRNRVINKDKINAFLKNPTAFIDASLVNLDLGFSARVKGATRFRHAYFGETDQSGIDWFSTRFGASEILSPKKLDQVIRDDEQLKAFRDVFEKARQTGAQEVEFGGKIFDVSDVDAVNAAIKQVGEGFLKVDSGREDDNVEGSVGGINKPDDDQRGPEELAVVDIQLNDEDLETPSETLEKVIQHVLVDEARLDWSNYLRKPFPHQTFGTRWILGLALDKKHLGGGLLADDMGLGKTFMSLAAMDHLYKDCRKNNTVEKPCLVVAPLSLLQNWADEVEQTFNDSPFSDVVILQSDGRLNEFRLGGVETKNQSLEEDSKGEIRYSLKIGSSFANQRLDTARRLVITTYQTLRDYQFSLCSVDWGMVVFDEAQNIKNPNALQTRAAKGIKADFRLIATGTPVENSLADFWCLMDTACPGYLDSYQKFRDAYIIPILRAAGDEVEHVRGLVGRQLREYVGSLMLRRVKDDNLDGLPDKTVFVGMEDSGWEHLPSLQSVLRDGQLESYDSILANAANSESNVVLASLQRLRDVSLHPRLVFGGGLDLSGTHGNLTTLMRESGKLQSLLAILDDIRNHKEKCIIFVINKKLQTFLSIALSKTYSLPPISVINGDAKAVAKRAGSQTRKSMIETFEGNEGFNLIIMSPIAAGVGLNVVGANNVIHLERHWNPAKEAQATDRVYRIGQTRNVNVFIPLIHHPEFQSFDVNLHQLLSKKSLLKDAVVTPEQVLPAPEGFQQGSWSPIRHIRAEDLAKLSWGQFEALSAELMLREFQAENCWLTHSGGDYGADVILIRGISATLIQCKHTKTGAYDGYRAVTEVYSARVKYQEELGKEIQSLLFVTNATRLSTKTRDVARQYSVQVLDGKSLSDLLDKHPVTLADVLARLDKKRYGV